MTFRHARQETAYLRMKAGEGFLYVAEIVDRDAVKIGFSLDPKARMRRLRWCLRCKQLRLLAFVAGSIADERRLHHTLLGLSLAKNSGPQEVYPRSILTHEALPEGLRVAA